MSLSVIVLAAGRGVRMRSSLPKVLHPIGGMPILSRIVSTVSQLNPDRIVIVHGPHAEPIQKALAAAPVTWVEQSVPRGTGHAALQALPWISGSNQVLILYGDIPLITLSTLQRLLEGAQDNAVSLMTAKVSDPTGLGRIIRDRNQTVTHIVEEKDATPAERTIQEINTGFFVASSQYLEKWLPQLTTHNNQKEYCLTDIIQLATQAGVIVNTVSPDHPWEVMGINDKIQLASLERIFQKEQAMEWMRQGVTLLDPNRFDIRGHVVIDQDVVIDINVILAGDVVIGRGVSIGPNVWIKNTVIQEGVQILANSVIEGAVIGSGCRVGPFARIRPGTELSEAVQVGNFVELKQSAIGRDSKINHLSYIGDAVIGTTTNIGAGVITCNFDGQKKHQTMIGDRVLVGADTQLIAPVTVGNDVVVAAGTTVRKEVPAGHLIHNCVSQKIIEKNQKNINRE